MSGSEGRTARALLERARAALEQAHDDPAASEAAATEVLDAAPAGSEAEQVAAWARGRARHELGRFEVALADLRRSAAVAAERGDLGAAARISANRALTEYAVGDLDAARASLDGAEDRLVGGEAGHLHLQRAIIQVHEGDLLDGRSSFDRALGLLADAGDRAAVLRCLTSRAVASTYLGDLAAATEDLEAAVALAEELGQRLLAAGAQHNLGYVRARAGDARQALELFSRAEEAYTAVGSPERVLAALEQDRAEVLLDAGLLPEAVRAARAAITRHLADGADTAAQDSQLLLVEALLAAGELDAAGSIAAELAGRLAAAGRAPVAARARAVAARAALAADPTAAGALARAAEARDALAAAGWRIEADRLVVDVCEGLAGSRLPASWSEHLLPIAASRRSGPAAARLRSWHAEAIVRAANGDRRGALRAVRAGLRVADEHRRSLAGDEVRAGAAHRSSALADIGVRLAVAGGRPADVLTWSEQARARSLLDAMPEPGDSELVDLLVDLRQARAAADADQRSSSAKREIARLEQAIRDLAARREPSGGPSGLVPMAAPSVRERLGDATLASYVEVAGRLLLIAADARRVRSVDVGPVVEVRAILDRLLLSMGRLVRGGAGAGVQAALAGFDDDRATLARQLQVSELGDGAVVVVPSASLRSVPWAALSPLTGRPVTVAPSATHWCRERSRAAAGRPLFAAGPGLAHAEAEVVALAGEDADVVVGAAATVATVVEAFGSRRLLHLAAHGEFRSDAPLFGGVDLVDGRLTVLDLRTAPGHPELVVLPACHLAATRALAGGESLGAVAALLGRGVHTVVAPLLAVGDEPAATLMAAFHRQLAAGGPAAALGQAVAQVLASGGPEAATAVAFTCAGRG